MVLTPLGVIGCTGLLWLCTCLFAAMLLEAREDAYDGEVRHARQLVTALERDILRSIELYELSMSAAAQGATNPRVMSLSEMRRRLSHRRRQGEKHDLRWPPGCDRRRQDGVWRLADRIARVSGHVEQVSAPLAALAAEFPGNGVAVENIAFVLSGRANAVKGCGWTQPLTSFFVHGQIVFDRRNARNTLGNFPSEIDLRLVRSHSY
jgi:hypothetical protein